MIAFIIAVLFLLLVLFILTICVNICFYVGQNIYHKELDNKLKEALNNYQDWSLQGGDWVRIKVGKGSIESCRTSLVYARATIWEEGYISERFRPSIVTAIKVMVKVDKRIRLNAKSKKVQIANVLTKKLEGDK